MDNDPDTTSDDRDDRGHGGFRPGAGRKRKQSAASIQIMSKKRRERAAHRQTMSRYRAKLTQWIDELKWSHEGIQSSYRDNATALLVIFNIMLENVNLTQTEAIVKAGLYLGRAHSTLDTLVSHWNKYKEVYVESGFSGESVDQRSADLFTTLPYFIITTIINRHAAGVTTTVKDIQQAITDTHGTHIGYWSIYYLMHDKMKLSYGLLEDATNLIQDPNRLKRIGQFLIKYASALKLEKKKEAVICYMDESYVTTGHHSHYGWYSDNEDKDIRTGAGVGKRLILVHAITNDGLLHKTGNSNNKTISAELIYEAKHPLGDYHSNMNGYNFRLWINQHLFPAFQAKYGRKKRMILVLDNAPYHKERGDDYVNIKLMSKIDMIDLLVSKGVQNITIIPNGYPKEFQANEWKFNGPLGPYKKELQLYMESWIKQYPELQKTLLENLFVEKSLHVKANMPDFHYLIYIPPYCPQVQPIELVWAYVKAYVAKQFTTSRTLQQLIEHTKEGFNGNGAEHEGVSSEMVRKMILHTHKYCNMLIDDDCWLEGSIDNLKNVDQYEEADEDAEDEDEDNDINMDTLAIIE
ncbi:unnamed protein product [Rotaria sp. Silwood1]|nr:unnamed protein product [Rotaria sp. Silwood1]CAF0934959.1 unnamed protein product [Rotaria sp. Silwood1]CAF1024190.1 unnamed protein product [Rotaria sp. Silwood1]CAF3342981.1 unnamed protein product [Rotaria sp. Silwood1]CAF3365816.1 unnamed protein product [Rotaria sp. Silwood1]